MLAVGSGSKDSAQDVALSVYKTLLERKRTIKNMCLQLKRYRMLMKHNSWKAEFKEPKAYILYRKKSSTKTNRSFQKRINLKPYEYPHLYEYVKAIRHSYWIHSEFNFTSDIQDFKSRLTDTERSAVKKQCWQFLKLSSCQIIWGDLYHRVQNQKSVQ